MTLLRDSLIHVTYAMLGFVAFCIVGTAVGLIYPFWWGGEALFVPMFGLIVLLVCAPLATWIQENIYRIVFSTSFSSRLAKLSALLDGFFLIPAFLVATAVYYGVTHSREMFPFLMLIGFAAVVSPLVSSVVVCAARKLLIRSRRELPEL